MTERPFVRSGNVAIFVYWSKEDSLEPNTIRYVAELLKVANTVLFVSNSLLKPQDVFKLRKMGADFLQRVNRGFDFWGWKEGIEYLKEQIKLAENLILCNSSCFLAFSSLRQLLEKMDNKADFWGVSSFRDRASAFHLQSYFLVFKRTMLEDWDAFFSFWNNLPKMHKWRDAVELGELKLTQFYLSKGFNCREIASCCSLPSDDVNPSFYYPVELFQAGSPFLKKKIFFEDYLLFLSKSCGETPRMAMNYVHDNGGFYSEILQELIKNLTPSQLIRKLNLNYIINGIKLKDNSLSDKRVAVICFVFYEDLIDYVSSILIRFDKIAKIYIVSSKKDLLVLYKNKLTNKLEESEYRLQQNRGRNEAAYFITCKDIWQEFDYVCALHDKKTKHVTPALQGIEFMKHCEKNLCPSAASIAEIVDIFEQNPLLGLLVPPLPFFGNFISSVFNPIGRNQRSLALLNEKLFAGKLFSGSQLDVFSAPFGGMFWARTKALEPLSSSPLSINDFPQEPLKSSDGTILHAFERVYPLVTRKAGFYTARVFNIFQVSLQYTNLLFFCVGLTKKQILIFKLKNSLKILLSRYPRLYDWARVILNKITLR